MSSKKPIVGLIFLIGVALVTVGAGFYTVFPPLKPTCPAPVGVYNLTVTIHQWYFEINGTDATKNGWCIPHGSIVTFVIKGTWEHDAEISANYTQHSFFISALMSSPVTVSGSQVARTGALNFNIPGDVTLVCTIFCGTLPGVGGHPITTTIHVT